MMGLKTILKTKKIVSAFLLVAVLLPLVANPIAAYDSTPLGEPPEFGMDYYYEVYRPAIDSPQMNLESFVNETVKGLLIGWPLYVIDHTPLGIFFYFFMCGSQLGTGQLGKFIECINERVPKQYWSIIGEFLPGVKGPESQVVAQNPGVLSSTYQGFKKIAQTSPLSGFRFIDYYGKKLGIIQEVSAQETTTSFGFEALSGFIELWSASRNLTYALFAFALVIIGFMIMFRVKISPQAVVTVQAAIPKIVITLLLITFSYALVGFALDLTWLFTLLFANLIGAPQGLIDSLLNTSVLTFLFKPAFLGKGVMLSFSLVSNLLGEALRFITLPATPVISLVLFLFLGIMVLISAFKMTFMLVKAYVYIVLYTIIGPVWIFMGVFPGAQGLGSWFRTIISQIIVFPATASLLFLAQRIMPGFGNLGAIISASKVQLPLMGQFTNMQARAVIGLTLVIFTPKLAKTLQELFKAVSFGRGTGIGEALGPIAGLGPLGWQGAKGAGIQWGGERLTHLASDKTGTLGRLAAWGERAATGLGYRGKTPSQREDKSAPITSRGEG